MRENNYDLYKIYFLCKIESDLVQLLDLKPLSYHKLYRSYIQKLIIYGNNDFYNDF
jgi:hypothetical protein